ncbi:polymer-forming cytoskeletal protein [Verrucomicrobiaceae bacterium 5K15]|uniref:Polymer-forming cytoskeletal protein n=1 Tax=Oceaniferula flava TaxID=2800421 RepID=A0AAE2SC45_9BACT|nr:polymer-forming cytoskeletal protein [Oceaniferula flavus]MBK1854297.1 polymer-forming cytoskeletal protein [Oceaniferula flavus]MBM1135603.1 polymer-forming cytoskeletal protein [Oceaniferula flavus]
MAFFSKKKKNDTPKEPAARKNTVDLSCPDCGFKQTESNMAVSTYCRGCGVHYKIVDGKAEPNKIAPSNPFATLKSDGQAPRLRPRQDDDQADKASKDQPAAEKKEDEKPKAETPKSKPTSPFPFAKPKADVASFVQKAAASTGLFHGKDQPRKVRCFECEREHEAPAEASSTLCPGCGAYIALKDYDIHSNWNRRIQTRGNVVIHKKASVTGITIHCHHLTTHGDFTGGVDCSGDFTIRSHGKIMGRVRCKRLIIEKRAQVEFANAVHCEDAIIDGNVTGHFECSGKLILRKKATLTGDIKVATMAVEEGARHNGRMSIGQ